MPPPEKKDDKEVNKPKAKPFTYVEVDGKKQLRFMRNLKNCTCVDQESVPLEQMGKDRKAFVDLPDQYKKFELHSFKQPLTKFEDKISKQKEDAKSLLLQSPVQKQRTFQVHKDVSEDKYNGIVTATQTPDISTNNAYISRLISTLETNIESDLEKTNNQYMQTLKDVTQEQAKLQRARIDAQQAQIYKKLNKGKKHH